MTEPFAGEIRMFAGNFAPRGNAFCDGQLLAVSQNDALFSLLGTTFGGDGRTTFGLPDLRGRIPVHAGSGAGPGLTQRRLGNKSGSETETVNVAQLPAHSHRMSADTTPGTQSNPENQVLAAGTNVRLFRLLNQLQAPIEVMAPSALSEVGGSRSHTNLMPFLCIHFIIALFGIYPSRS